MDKNVQNEDNMREKEYYKEKIFEIVRGMKSERFIKMIYAFSKSLSEEEKTGGF